MLKNQSKERLLMVAEVLENLPKGRKFDLGIWSSTKKAACGTTACACGYAGLEPWFNRRGFALSKINNRWGGHKPVFDRPNKRRLYGDKTVKGFFSINKAQFLFLFIEDSYKRGNKSDVIRRIRKFVKNDGEIR